MNGASLAEIAEVLGHKTLSMVKRYAHLSEAHTASRGRADERAVFRGLGHGPRSPREAAKEGNERARSEENAKGRS